MDQQPLNTGEQKDMSEFFINLLTKMEEMTPNLKKIIKSLFCGTIANNVVSLECGHMSTTTEEFYTVMCQVIQKRRYFYDFIKNYYVKGGGDAESWSESGGGLCQRNADWWQHAYVLAVRHKGGRISLLFVYVF